MPVKNLNPYVMYNGTAERVIQLYETAIGARVENVMRFGYVAQTPAAPQHKDLVMHASIRFGDSVLMLSDTTPDTPVPAEGNTQVTLHFTEPGEMQRAFDAVSAGGKVRLPLQDMFWGARFGMLTDAYGVQWMFSCELTRS